MLGYAQLVSGTLDSFELKATREADGTVLTCVVSFREKADLDWAIAVWKAVRPP